MRRRSRDRGTETAEGRQLGEERRRLEGEADRGSLQLARLGGSFGYFGVDGTGQVNMGRHGKFLILVTVRHPEIPKVYLKTTNASLRGLSAL